MYSHSFVIAQLDLHTHKVGYTLCVCKSTKYADVNFQEICDMYMYINYS